jgi:hypothetical protein
MRPTPLAWMLLGSLVGTIVVWPFSETVSLILGAVFGLLVLTAVSDALGGGDNALWGDGPLDVGETSDRKRTALRRLAPGRDWHRKAPDFADEPQDAIFDRERKRRGLG